MFESRIGEHASDPRRFVDGIGNIVKAQQMEGDVRQPRRDRPVRVQEALAQGFFVARAIEEDADEVTGEVARSIRGHSDGNRAAAEERFPVPAIEDDLRSH